MREAVPEMRYVFSQQLKALETVTMMLICFAAVSQLQLHCTGKVTLKWLIKR